MKIHILIMNLEALGSKLNMEILLNENLLGPE